MTSPVPPTPPRHRRRYLLAGVGFLVLLGAAVLLWYLVFKPAPPPQPDRMAATQANLRGIGHMEQFQYAAAVTDFTEALKFDPDWTPAKINLAIALLNTATPENLWRARTLFDQVLAQEPDNLHAHYCQGMIAIHENRLRDAYPHFEAVSRADPTDAHTWMHLGMTHPKGRESAEAKECFAQALKLNPYLNAARYALAQHPVERNLERTKQLLDEHKALMEANWEVEYRIAYTEMGRYAEVIGHLAETKTADIAPLPLFETWKTEVRLAAGTTWAGTDDFDAATRTQRQRFGLSLVLLDYNRDGRVDLFLCGAVKRDKQLGDLLLRNDGNGVFTDVSSEAKLLGSASGGSAADYDNDGFADLLLIRNGLPRLFRNTGNGTFEDVSEKGGLLDLKGVFLSATWFDIDQDGDLDLALSQFAEKGGVVLLLNVGEAPPAPSGARQPPLSTRFRYHPLPATLPIEGAVVATAASDVDGDRDVDLLLFADGQPVRGIGNDRLLRFHSLGDLAAPGKWNGGLVFDVNHDQRSDLFVVATEAAPALWINRNKSPDTLAVTYTAGTLNAPALLHAQAVDLNLDSWVDVVGLSTQREPILLLNEGGKLALRKEAFGPATELPANIQGLSVVDLDGDGPADLLLIAANGLTVRRNRGNGNHVVRLELTGRRDKGANMRTNADGIGAWVTAQSGTLFSGSENTTRQAGLAQSSLPLDLGLGKATQADVVRIRWPDGVPQAELGIAVDRLVKIEELNRKGTSCPVLFVWDGRRYRFVTDFLGGGALGETNPDGSLRQPRPEEALKIEPGLLVPRDGWYHIKVSEPMDEVLYLDRLQLVVIDQPATEAVYPDERFGGPAPTQELLQIGALQTARRASTPRTDDVTAQLRSVDRRFVDDFHLRSWLGYAEDHWLELDFGNVAATPGDRFVLCLTGWTDYPYPESIYAASQAGIDLLMPSLEYQTADGKWANWGELGFPAGLPKTMTREVTELVKLSKGRFRIRTNMQVYWDQIRLGRLVKQPTARITMLEPGTATLHKRGFAQEVYPDGQLPLIYDDDRKEAVAVTAWKGRLTRFGAVGELLTAHDDRFALCGPGEEIEIAFDARQLPPLPADHVRSFVLRTWGYCKDTSPFTQTGGQVGPLPYRAMSSYPPPRPKLLDYDRLWNTRPLGRE